MNVLFTDGSGPTRKCLLSDNCDLSEFKSTAEKLFGPLKNFRFVVKGRELEMNDAEKFNAQRNLLTNNCSICVLKRMI